MGLTPVVNGQVHHFSVGGLYNGLALLIDDETRSYWDHITGEAVYGSLLGSQLAIWPTVLTTVKAALAQYPDLEISLSTFRSFRSVLMQFVNRRVIHTKGWLPPFFRRTMTEQDQRLPGMTQGLGVIVNRRARYYPMGAIPREGIEDDWEGRALLLGRGRIDGVPFAIWKDNGSRPFQMLSRWYGFSFTYPDCEIYPDSRP